jgi:hypothetical protein
VFTGCTGKPLKGWQGNGAAAPAEDEGALDAEKLGWTSAQAWRKKKTTYNKKQLRKEVRRARNRARARAHATGFPCMHGLVASALVSASLLSALEPSTSWRRRRRSFPRARKKRSCVLWRRRNTFVRRHLATSTIIFPPYFEHLLTDFLFLALPRCAGLSDSMYEGSQAWATAFQRRCRQVGRQYKLLTDS